MHSQVYPIALASASQALSATLLRIEAEGPSGTFEDRSTFFARNRSWAGLPITVHNAGPNSSTLSTSSWTLELSAGTPDPAEAVTDGVQTSMTSSIRSFGSSCGNALHGSEVSAGSKLSSI